MLAGLSATAQTVSTFDDITLPAPDTTYLDVTPGPDGYFPFRSGNVTFYGKKDFGGSYKTSFNCSNHTDTVTPGFTNMWAAITGAGADNSDNYGIAFVDMDYSNPAYPTMPVGAKLEDAAAGNIVAGAYFTNSVYAYRYMLDNDYYAANQYWLKLIVRGYLNGTQVADSAVFTLADYSGATPVLVNSWQWVDLSVLGAVDSLTFDLASNDAGASGINTPAYFAIDNLVTLDGVCPQAQNVAATSINENSATISWNAGIPAGAPSYEIAVDQSATLAPTAPTETVAALSYSAGPLSPNTTYYVHIRSKCGANDFSPWDTASFRTLATTGIGDHPGRQLSFTLSPNPARNILHIEAPAPVDATVYDLQGRRLIQASHTTCLDISSLPAGVYMLKASDRDNNRAGVLRFTKTGY